MRYAPGDLRHDLRRLREIAGVAARYGFAPTLRRMPLLRNLDFRRTDDEQLGEPAPIRFARMLEELGPTFVKLGQILSTRGDLLPADFVDALTHLQDRVPPVPFDAITRQIEVGLGQPWKALFAHVDTEPLASASVAQVHAARTTDGDDVVIKVQRPDIEEQVRGDLALLVVTAQLLEGLVSEASQIRAVDLAEEFEEGLRTELDFDIEARNLAAFAAKNEGRQGIVVPRPYLELSGRTVLTMERIEGRRITALADDPNPLRTQTIVERLVMLTYEHIFVDGLFHADPHPGNVLVTARDEICFIDFGLVGRVARGTQERMLMLMIALSLRDADTVSRLVMRLGACDARVDLRKLRDAIARLLDRYLGLAVADVDASGALADLLDLAAEHGIRMPREFALLAKAAIATDGIVRQLHPDLKPQAMLANRSQELLLARLDPRKIGGEGIRSALQLGVLVQELPLQLSQILQDLERGQLEIQMRADALDRLERNLRGLGMTVFGGLMAAALTLGGIFVLAKNEATLWGIPLLPAVAFLLAGGMFGVAFTWFLTGGQFPKLSISRLFLRGRRRLGPASERRIVHGRRASDGQDNPESARFS